MFGFDKHHTTLRPYLLGARFARMGTTSAVLACLTMTSGLANAGALLTFVETENGIVATLSGTLDLTDAVVTGSSGDFTSGGGVWGSGALARNYGDTGLASDQQPYTKYAITGPSSFGTGGSFGASAVDTSPTQFLLYGGASDPYLGLRTNFTGGEVSGSMTFANDRGTFDAYGLIEGTYVYTLADSIDTFNGDTFTVQIGENSGQTSENAVPAPATPLLIAAGILGGGLSRRLRRTFA